MQPKKILFKTEIHGYTLEDPFAWTKNREDPDLIPALKKENEHTNTSLHALEPLRDKIFKETISKIVEDDQEHPYRMGTFEYYSQIKKGENYASYFRQPIGSKNKTLILDLNELAKGKPFLHSSGFSISPDQKKIAYGIDTEGSEYYQIFIQDLETKKILDQSLVKTSGDFTWCDNNSLYYTKVDSTHRPDRVFLHNIGDSKEKDPLLFQENDLQFYVSISKSKSDRFLFIESESKITSEILYIDIHNNPEQVLSFFPKKKNCKYTIEHQEGRFLILTNEDADNYKLMWAPLEKPSRENWQELTPYDPARTIEEIDVYKNYFITYEKVQGVEQYRVFKENTCVDTIKFEDPCYATYIDHNYVYDADFFRFGHSSLRTPKQIFHYSFQTQQSNVVHEKTIPGHEANQYVTERVYARSRDQKTEIPISLVYKKGLSKDGKSPLFLYGYGSYGITRSCSFSPSVFSLLDRGFVYAIAHIRGGGACGRTWYYDGRREKKKNTFFDFIDCAEFLIEKGYTAKKKIAICGGSAGGLLMGACTNMRPELWGAVLSLVPFVDVVNTMLDETLPLTVTEYDEWGNPKIQKDFEQILSYSPYENIQKLTYPPILATGGLHDPRVGYWEPTKWVWKLRENNQGENPIFLKIELEAGHQGPSGRYHVYRETAFYYAFVIDQLT